MSIHEIRTTETSLIGLGSRGEQAVVLKVIRKEGSEEWRCGEILDAFGGHGMIRPIAHVPGAVLLPRLRPGHDLSAVSLGGQDDEATEVVAELIGEMSRASSVPGVASVERLGPDFGRLRDGGADVIGADLIDEAEILFFDLCASQRGVRLVHGDLHHYNILFDDNEGWVAIDPWGAIGELEFEVGAALRNPIGGPHLLQDVKVLERRLMIYERHLAFNPQRALRWAFATTVLGILWPFEEGVGADMRRPFRQYGMTSSLS